MVDASTANTPIPGGWDRRNTIPGIEEIIRILVVLLEIESQNASTNSQDISLVRYHKSACLHIYYTTRRATTMMFPKVFYYYLFTGFAVFNLAVGDDICGFGGTKCQPCAINGETNSTL